MRKKPKRVVVGLTDPLSDKVLRHLAAAVKLAKAKDDLGRPVKKKVKGR